ncbi:MAG: hypothetical protein CMG61_06380 [Candidatus Marinimicrobia bacterium]|nr:hypothetical protein [Candidatus Neomarinimicrobiota bacterium]
MIKKNKKPSFFVVGMQKSGTTTLHKWLDSHPEITLPNYKETHFFSDEKKFSKGFKWYLNNFKIKKTSKLIGEVDPSYIFIDSALEKIKTIIDNPKFVILIRNPLERSYSHYCMNIYKGYEKFSFPKALELESKRLKRGENEFRNFSYLARSNYSYLIKRLIKKFPQSEILYIKFEDITKTENQEDAYARICSFLNVENKKNVNLSLPYNVKKTFKSRYLRDFLFGESKLKTIFKKIIPYNYHYLLKRTIEKFNTKKIKNNNTDVLKKISKKYLNESNNETLKLMKITKLNLNDWIYDL